MRVGRYNHNPYVSVCWRSQCSSFIRSLHLPNCLADQGEAQAQQPARRSTAAGALLLPLPCCRLVQARGLNWQSDTPILRFPSSAQTLSPDEEYELLPLELFQPDDPQQMDMLMLALARTPEVAHHFLQVPIRLCRFLVSSACVLSLCAICLTSLCRCAVQHHVFDAVMRQQVCSLPVCITR